MNIHFHKIGLAPLAIIALAFAAGCGTTATQAPKAPVAMAAEPVVAPPTQAEWRITVGEPTVGATQHETATVSYAHNTLCSGATENGGTQCVQAPTYSFVATR